MALQIHQEQLLKRPIEQVFAFFAQAENLNLLTPPWVRFSILTSMPIEMAVGTIIEYRIRLRGVPVKWRSEITEWDPPFAFCDEQRRGPYRFWIHRHTFEERPDGTLVTDHVDYGVLGGALVNRLLVAGELRRIFDYRRERLAELFPDGRCRRPSPRHSREKRPLHNSRFQFSRSPTLSF